MKRMKKGSAGFMHRLAEFIVDKRKLIFVAILIGVIFSFVGMGLVEVESDLSAFLPTKSDSKQAVDVMNEEFTLYGTATIMVANITPEQAMELKDKISAVDGVQMVDYAEDDAHYRNASACYTLTFEHIQTTKECTASLESVKSTLSEYDIYVSSDIGNPLEAVLNDEIFVIMIVAAVAILTILFLTSKSIMEVPVILITFLAAMIFSMGTNFIFGKVSFVSNSVTSVLQLALSLDYAVILINRFREERERLSMRDAVVEALAHAVPEVLGSSLTTVGGLAAMMFMQFRLGPDMGKCLIKAILFAMLSVFIFMPGLLMVFGKSIKKTEHKSLVPKVSFIGKFAYASRKIVAPLFVVVIIAAMFISSACPFSYGYTSQDAAKMNDQTMAKKIISDNFGYTNMIALVVPTGDYEKEAKLLDELEEYDEVAYTMGLANTEAMDGYCLADGLTPRQFAELVDLDYEMAALLYTMYVTDIEGLGGIITDVSTYKIPLIDLFMFVTETVDPATLNLEGEQAAMLSEAKGMMANAKAMMVGENYSRMVVYLNLPEDSDETFNFIDKIEEIAKSYYPDGNVYMAGSSTTAKDFKESFEIDNIIVTAISIIIVLAVLLVSFKSLAMPIILILVIQGAIWINFSIPSIMNTPLFFLGYIIISAMQMGANIDYAIVIATRYQQERKHLEKREAIIETMNFAFPTVITSGLIMSLTGLFIGYLSSEATISSLGINLGRGTIVSIILVLFVLPQLLLVGDGLITKTSFNIFKKKEKKESTLDGRMHICGVVSGEINGSINGTIDAVIDGNANITLHSGVINEEKEESTNE